MSTVPEACARCKLALTDGRTGACYRVEKLPRAAGDYRRGFRLTGPDGAPAFAHELPCGLRECSCPAWTVGRECEHTRLLVAAGLFDDPVDVREPGQPDYPEDDLVDIDWESEAP